MHSHNLPFLLWLRLAMLQRIEHVVFKQLLIADAHLNWMTRRTVFLVPAFDERYINSTTRTSRAHIKRTWCPQQCNAIGGIVSIQWCILQERLHIIGQRKILIIIGQRFLHFRVCITMRNGIDKGIKVEGWQIGIFGLDVDYVGCVVPKRKMERILVRLNLYLITFFM